MGYADLFSFYRSVEWGKFRQVIMSERLNDANDLLCEHCGKVIVHPYDAVLHHKIQLTEANVHDVNIALNPDNVMVVCHKCHNEIHERFGWAPSVKKIYIVWGSPLSGKSTYVDSVAGKHDLIIDINRIYASINNDRSNLLYPNVMTIYRQLVDMVKTRNGRWRNAWIMRSLPLRIDRENIVKDLGGGELIHIDTDKETCLLRAKEKGKDAEEYTKKYWEMYQESPPL